MIDIGHRNKIIIGKGGDFILHSLIDFYDTIGKNVLYIIGDKNYPLKCNTIKVNRYEWEEAEEKIMSNLFRLDYIIVRSNFYSDKIFELIDKKIKLPSFHIVEGSGASNRYDMLSDKIYYFYRDGNIFKNPLSFNTFNASDDIFNEDSYMIKDVKNNFIDSLHNIKVRWIRDKKLEDLFNKD